MAVMAEIIDMDELFRTIPGRPVILNDFDIKSEEDKEKIDRILKTEYGSDFLNVEPACQCGARHGGQYIGTLCPECATMVLNVTDRPLKPSVWIKVFDGVKAFINPKVWAILSKNLTISRFDILEHLVNPTAPGPETSAQPVRKYMELGIPRGINYFVDHFDEIFQALIDGKVLRPDNQDKLNGTGKLSTLMAFITQYRDRIFCHYLPLPSKVFVITEKTPMTTFASSQVLPLLNAALIVSEMHGDTRAKSARGIQSRAMRVNALLVEYSETNFSKFFDNKKHGWIRKHIFGTRSHFSARAVIDSNHNPHDYRDIEIPWSLAVLLFRIHLISKLTRRGYSLNESMNLLDVKTMQYDPLLDTIFQELIQESPDHHIPVLMNRNPSLLRGSIQELFISKVKTDVEIKSISISSLILPNFNADFDGDALNFMLLLDHRMSRRLSRMAPHLTVLDANKPRSFSKAMKMPEPIITTMAAFINEETR